MSYFFKKTQDYFHKPLLVFLMVLSTVLCNNIAVYAQTQPTSSNTNQINLSPSNIASPPINTIENTTNTNLKNENKDLKISSNSNTNNSLQNLSSTLASSVLMLLILGSCIWLIKRHKLPGKNSLLKPISVLSVGTREKIMVIELNDTWMVIGVTSNQISLIQNLQKNPDVNLSKHNETSLPIKSFSEILKKKIGLIKKNDQTNQHQL